jgi:hypothetical protein
MMIIWNSIPSTEPRLKGQPLSFGEQYERLRENYDHQAKGEAERKMV